MTIELLQDTMIMTLIITICIGIDIFLEKRKGL